MQIQSAEKYKQYGRIVFWGVEKSGKTHGALALATLLAEGGKVGVISSEYASSQLLAHRFPHDIIDLTEVDENGNIAKNAFSASRYEEAIRLFVQAGYKVIVIDSLSHLWEGEGGILDAVNSRKGNTFNDGWGENSPVYRKVIHTILSARCHVIVTLRAKDNYVQQDYLKNDGTKGSKPVNIGLAPVMRKNFGFEMHLKIRMDSMIGYVEATAMQAYIPRGEEIETIDENLAARLLNALDGIPLPEATAQQKAMRTLLDEFYSLAPLTYARITNWEQQALRTALGIAKGASLPTDYSDSDVENMHAYVAKRRKEKEEKEKRTADPAPPPIEEEMPELPVDQPSKESAASDVPQINPAKPDQVAFLRKRIGEVKPQNSKGLLGTEAYYMSIFHQPYPGDEALPVHEWARMIRDLKDLEAKRKTPAEKKAS